MNRPRLSAVVLLAACLPCSAVWPETELVVGSKAFTESVILGEIVAERLRAEGFSVVHRAELGGTRVLWNALQRGDIDLYPEYTGTLRQEIFDGADPTSGLADADLRVTGSLGFSNGYALGMTRSGARRLDIGRLSDLARHPELKLGFSNEFMDRRDGWPALRDRYGLHTLRATGLDHDLAYRALASADIDVIDLYTTDAEIRYYDLQVLTDDLGHFADYSALLVYRADLEQRAPRAVEVLNGLAGTISPQQMIAMNGLVKVEGVPQARVVADFLAGAKLNGRDAPGEQAPSVWARLRQRTGEHLALVGVSMIGATIFALPVGVLAYRRPRIGQVVLAATGVVQTIPALALLVFMIPLLGIGWAPAVAALFLYSLLPIVRNTHAGLAAIATPIKESANAMGLTAYEQLRIVELPLASGAILAGIKTALVINIGTATLGALIGAGGYGQPILTGIRLDDLGLILEGALPAAGLALIAQALCEYLEKRVRA